MDIEQMAARDESAMERMAAAFETIADTLIAWYKLEQQRYDKEHPAKREVRDVDLTRIPSDKDKLLESLGASDESLTEWIGLREQAFVESPESGKAKRPARVEKKRSSPTPA